MNLLVTGAWQQATDYLEQLKKEHEVVFMQWENKELPCVYEWVEGIIGNGIFLSHPIEKFKNLRYIQLTSAGYDRVPMNYVKEHKIEIHNATFGGFIMSDKRAPRRSLDDWMELVEHAVKRIERWKMTKTDWITMIFPVIANGLLLYLFHKVIEKKFERVGKRNELRDEVIILFWKKCNK